MITKWILSNFKSVCKETALDLAPLTIFAGANSSGKSTILQSILLTAQTIQNPVLSKSVVLNGHIIRLGAFSDIISSSTSEQRITLGFQLQATTAIDSLNGTRVISEQYLESSSPDLAKKVKYIDCTYSFSNRGSDSDKDLLNLQPRLTAMELSATLNEGETSTDENQLKIVKSKNAPEERAKTFGIDIETLSPAERVSLEYEVTAPAKLRTGRQYRAFGTQFRSQSAGALLGHFLPLRMTGVLDATEEDAYSKVQSITSLVARMIPPNSPEIKWLFSANNALQERIYKIIKGLQLNLPESQQDFLKKIHVAEGENSPKLNEIFVRRLIWSLPADSHRQLITTLLAVQKELLELAKDSKDPEFVLRYAPMPEVPRYAADFIRNFFSSKLKYLGPLRDEPKPVYPLAGANDPRDVGFKGEHTAAVLDIHRNTIIQYIPSECFSHPDSKSEAKQASLIDAVADWLSYMGVVQTVKTEDLGKLGHGLKVSTPDSSALHDLTHVGVGVSQVLPILVLSLLSEQGSTLVFEQPELHLHPRVQTRLADFFVSMMLLRKQCIIETHSEYLINRLRFAAAAGSGRSISEKVLIYFVEKAEGSSKYNPVRINEFGVIQSWPKGFFDEGEETAAEILRIGISKRAQQK